MSWKDINVIMQLKNPLCIVMRIFIIKTHYSLFRSLRPQLSWTALMTKSINPSWAWSKLSSNSRMTSLNWKRSSISPLFRCTNLFFFVFLFQFKVYEIQFKTLESYSWLIYCIDLWPQSVGMALRDLIRSVDDILPTLHESVRTEVHYIVYNLFAVFFSPPCSLSALISPLKLFLLEKW